MQLKDRSSVVSAGGASSTPHGAIGAPRRSASAGGVGRVYALVRSAHDGLTKSEKLVADYLIEGGDHIVSLLSIAELADAANVSSATVVRFSRRLGFKGFSEFKRAVFSGLAMDQGQDEFGPYRTPAGTDDLGSVLSRLASLMQLALSDTFASLDVEVFETAVSKLTQAKRVRLFAHGGSGHIAASAVNKFLLLGTDCIAYTERLTHEASAMYLDGTDVAIALSHTGAAQSVERAVRVANQRGAATIAISNNASSPIARAAQLHLLTVVPGATAGSEAGVTRVAQIAMLDALALATAHARNTRMTQPQIKEGGG